MHLSIVIPCLNEAATLQECCRRALAAGKAAQKKGLRSFEVIVADNGSTDGSQEIVHQIRGVRLIEVNIRGYGAALHSGILAAKGEYVLYADADLSYDFGQLERFLPYILSGRYDLVLGSRWLGVIKPGAMPWPNRYLGTPVLTLLIRWLYDLGLTDCNSGMRLVRRQFYSQLHMRNAGMEWASEILIKTALYRGRYTEVPITLWPDRRRRPPHLVPWADGWRHLKAIILLQPNVLFIPSVGLLWAAGFVYPSYHLLSLWMSLVGFGLGLATLAAKLLHYAIDDNPSFLVTIIMRLPLAPLLGAGGLVLAVTSILEKLGDFLLLGLWAAWLLAALWVFLVETIKTNMIHRLPDTL
jgi:glycosyltransferase involved in cell wall biosynthesis